MTDQLPTIPAAIRVDDVCDYCRRTFAWARGTQPHCLSCGLVNVRESAMLAPAPEQAVKPTPKLRRRRTEKRSA